MADKKKLDETVPGGEYTNAQGQVVDASGKVLSTPKPTPTKKPKVTFTKKESK